MECHISRGLLKLRYVSSRAMHGHSSRLVEKRVSLGCFESSEKRLYHRDSYHQHRLGPYSSYQIRRQELLSAPVLSSSRTHAFRPPLARSIVISKIIDVFRNAEITSFEDFSKFIIHSSPVSAVRHFYELMEASTGLPWAANIVLCSALLQLVLNVPANIYMVKWATNKEKLVADLTAVKSSVMRSPSSANFAMFVRTSAELTRQYGCQNYKLFLTVSYQLTHVTITSFAVRSIFMQANPDILSAVTPWGALLASHDPSFVLPVINFCLSLLLVEVAAWKKTNSEVGQKMTHRRANLPFKGEPLYLVNVRRGVNVPMLLIYGIVPTALNIHWLVMMLTSINMQILLTHQPTRRLLGIPSAYFESDKPYRDFLHHLRYDVRIFKK